MPASRDPPQFRCKACPAGWWTSDALTKHQRTCYENRRSYLKIIAIGLDPSDHGPQEELWIQYGHVPNERRLTSNEHEEIGVMKRQLDLWKGAGRRLTRDFIWNLGSRSNDELIMAKSRKRKRTDGEEVPRANPLASVSANGTYHAPSPPPLEDLLPGPSTSGNIGGPPFGYYPGIQALRNLPSSQLGPPMSALQPPPPAASQSPLGDSTSEFDLAFAQWLDDESISKAAINRLIQDPAMQPITNLLSWSSVGQMKQKLKSVEGDEDE